MAVTRRRVQNPAYKPAQVFYKKQVFGLVFLSPHPILVKTNKTIDKRTKKIYNILNMYVSCVKHGISYPTLHIIFFPKGSLYEKMDHK